MDEFLFQAKNSMLMHNIESKLCELFHQREFWTKFISRNDELDDWAVTYNPSVFRPDTIDIAIKTKNSELFVHIPLVIK